MDYDLRRHRLLLATLMFQVRRYAYLDVCGAHIIRFLVSVSVCTPFASLIDDSACHEDASLRVSGNERQYCGLASLLSLFYRPIWTALSLLYLRTIFVGLLKLCFQVSG